MSPLRLRSGDISSLFYSDAPKQTSDQMLRCATQWPADAACTAMTTPEKSQYLQKCEADPQYRANIIKKQVEKYQTDAVYREIVHIRNTLKQRARNQQQRKYRSASTEKLESRLDDLLKGKSMTKKERRNQRERETGSRSTTRGKELHAANLKLRADRIIALKELADFKAAWKLKWGPVVATGRLMQKHKRSIQIAATKIDGDNALKKQIDFIRAGRCRCYWCNRNCRGNATVDHIIALAKGGTHTSDNIVAACSRCNSVKSDRTPEQAGLNGTLL